MGGQSDKRKNEGTEHELTVMVVFSSSFEGMLSSFIAIGCDLAVGIWASISPPSRAWEHAGVEGGY